MTNVNIESKVILSVIVPVYTTQVRFTYTEALLNTFVNFPIEVIYVRTSELCHEEVLTSNSRNTNYSIVSILGADPGTARNFGMEFAKGEWIAFWDSDDLPIAGKVFELLNKARHEGSEIAVGQFEIKNFDNEKLGRPDSIRSLDASFAMNPGLWRCLFKSEIARSAKFPSLRMAEDQVYLSRLDLEKLKFSISNEVIYTYMRYAGGQLTKSSAAISDLPKSILETKNIIEKQGISTFRTMSMLRQIITGLVKGNLRTKSRILRLCFTFLFYDRQLRLTQTLITLTLLKILRRTR